MESDLEQAPAVKALFDVAQGYFVVREPLEKSRINRNKRVHGCELRCRLFGLRRR